MNLRRTIATLLTALMLLALTACGAGTTPPAQDANDPAEETAPSTTESSQFRVGMECAYAPSNWQESAATDTNVPVENVAGAYAEGYDVQIARILADQLGKELVIVKLSWDGLIDALNQGQIDAIIAGMMDTAERRESINFSEPYRETTYGLMVLADSPYLNATSIQDFSGAAVLGQQGTALDDVIEQIEGVDHLSPVGSVPDMISRLQQGTCDAIVINVGRGPAVDQVALAEALNAGRIAGAALDVVVPEPLPREHPLWSTRNLLLTPHISGNMSLGYTCDINVDMFCRDLENYAAGRPLEHRVDRKRGY